MENTPWWESAKDLSPKTNQGPAEYWTIFNSLVMATIRDGQPPPKTYSLGYGLKFVGDFKELLKKLEAAGGKMCSEYRYNTVTDTNNATFIWPGGVVNMGDSSGQSINICHRDEDKLKELQDIIEPYFSKDKKGSIYVLSMGESGPYLSLLGIDKTVYVPENYDPSVVKAFDHIIDDIELEDPCGRLSIIDGPVGTGKTFLVKSMLSLCPESTFLIISPEMVSQLSGPSFVQTLIDHRSRTGMGKRKITDAKGRIKTNPLVLVVEDADNCLAARGPDNMHNISSLLNLGDGILGSLLDIRIIATTNAGSLGLKDDRIDPAILRPGRLCRRVQVKPLSAERANAVYQRLTKTESNPFAGPTSLAAVYKEAKSPEEKQEKKSNGIGFRAEAAEYREG
jgi:hypothetical protein